MEEFPPRFSKVLVTPDPQYIPGYAGYCPQLKYHLGETYGKLTARLLSSPEVLRSRRLVLYSGRAPPTESDGESGDKIWTSRHGNHRNMERMIPGYTGFVPKSRNYFSRTYGETCHEALSEFKRDQEQRKLLAASADLTHVKNGTVAGFTSHTYSTPLTPIAKEPAPYMPQDSWKPLGSPYFMDDTSPHKYFISGFTGYVPKSRFLIGTGYPITTNRALIQFGKEMRSPSGSLSFKEEPGSLPPLPAIYPSYRGQLPFYTGHVPGYKFRYGQTFGQLTHNALGSSINQRKTEANR
ncbi:protein FAM166B [Megalops cyprinoides]|uniref:protein FAM166B n=1 Tax=Megalops cyprinoides TaxID=118141 RepID=UPI0018645EFC|nr:protein FAM166B [Megalops cyprinoides]